MKFLGGLGRRLSKKSKLHTLRSNLQSWRICATFLVATTPAIAETGPEALRGQWCVAPGLGHLKRNRSHNIHESYVQRILQISTKQQRQKQHNMFPHSTKSGCTASNTKKHVLEQAWEIEKTTTWSLHPHFLCKKSSACREHCQRQLSLGSRASQETHPFIVFPGSTRGELLLLL